MVSNQRKKSILILSLWTVYVFGLFFYFPKATDFMIQGMILTSLSIYLLYNPAYLGLIYFIHRTSARLGKNAFKRLVGSVLIIIAFDFVAMPRFALDNVPLNISAVAASNFGAIIIGNLDKFLPHTISFSLFYLVFPIVIFAIGLELVGVINFIRNGGIQ